MTELKLFPLGGEVLLKGPEAVLSRAVELLGAVWPSAERRAARLTAALAVVAKHLPRLAAALKAVEAPQSAALLSAAQHFDLRRTESVSERKRRKRYLLRYDIYIYYV